MNGITNAIGETLPDYLDVKGVKVKDSESNLYTSIGKNYLSAKNDDSNSSLYLNPDGGIVYLSGTSVFTNGSVLFGAAWNDYAEFRNIKDDTKNPYGRCVCENGDDTVSLSRHRLQPVPYIVSDTFGFVIGENKDNCVPVAVSGRVLAYTLENRDTFKVGDVVCAAENGTVSKMSREEIMEYPDRIVGIVSSIPMYDKWGENNINVNGRIWIKVK